MGKHPKTSQIARFSIGHQIIYFVTKSYEINNNLAKYWSLVLISMRILILVMHPENSFESNVKCEKYSK